MTLARDPTPVIVLALNLDDFTAVMHSYGLEPGAEGVYPVYDLPGAQALGLATSTPWCFTTFLVSSPARVYLGGVYGSPKTVDKALKMYETGFAIDPKVLRAARA